MNINNPKITKTTIWERLLAILLLVILFPIILLISILSYIDTKKFPFYIQDRGLTLEKYRFKLIKFRTIREKNTSDESDDSSRFILKKSYYYDRVSPIGRFLRKTGLDELPQLINILLGQMKFIGPRALSIEDLSKIKLFFPESYRRRNELVSMPGIIGLWQVNKDFECSIDKLIELDEFYERNKSLILDIRIFAKAFIIIFFGYHIDSIVNGKRLMVYPFFVYASIISIIFLLFLIINNFWN